MLVALLFLHNDLSIHEADDSAKDDGISSVWPLCSWTPLTIHALETRYSVLDYMQPGILGSGARQSQGWPLALFDDSQSRITRPLCDLPSFHNFRCCFFPPSLFCRLRHSASCSSTSSIHSAESRFPAQILVVIASAVVAAHRPTRVILRIPGGNNGNESHTSLSKHTGTCL